MSESNARAGWVEALRAKAHAREPVAHPAQQQMRP